MQITILVRNTEKYKDLNSAINYFTNKLDYDS